MNTVPSDRQLQAVDDRGLTLLQRKTLQELAEQSDWRAACAAVQVKPSTVKSWMQHNPAFIDAYNELVGPALSLAQESMESHAMKASGMYDEALEAVKMVSLEVVCPSCKNEFSVSNPGPDWNARLRAGDTVLKVSQILIDRKKIESTNINLNVEEAMAWAQVRYAQQHGLPITISPNMVEKLREKGRTIATTPAAVVDAVDDRLQS